MCLVHISMSSSRQNSLTRSNSSVQPSKHQHSYPSSYSCISAFDFYVPIPPNYVTSSTDEAMAPTKRRSRAWGLCGASRTTVPSGRAFVDSDNVSWNDNYGAYKTSVTVAASDFGLNSLSLWFNNY